MIDNIGRARELLRIIKLDFDMISDKKRDKYVLEALTLNTEAYLCQKNNKYGEALSLLEQVEELQKFHEAGSIEIARTKLNKCIVVCHLDRYLHGHVDRKNPWIYVEKPWFS